jgi:hypothetical protein
MTIHLDAVPVRQLKGNLLMLFAVYFSYIGMQFLSVKAGNKFSATIDSIV